MCVETVSKNRHRLLGRDIADAVFDAVLLRADTEELLSDERFATGRSGRPSR